MNPLDFDQVDFLINKEMKLQFFNEVGYSLPSSDTIQTIANLKVAPLPTIGAMKIKTMFQRNAYRDYYDIYCMVKGQHINIQQLISISCTYDKKLNTDMIVNRLVRHEKFREEKNFGMLSPKYEVSSEDIGKFFSENLK